MLAAPLAAQNGEAKSASPDSADMMSLPDIGLDWPDLAAPEPPLPEENGDAPDSAVVMPDAPLPSPEPASAETGSAPESGAETGLTVIAALDPAASLSYIYRIEGLGEAGDARLLERFDALSALKAGGRETANVAQIRRRARADATLLDELLRVRGYYDSRTRVEFRPGRKAGEINTILSANPGEAYHIGRIDMDGPTDEKVGDKTVPDLFAIRTGARADTDDIQAATQALRDQLLESGYPFSSVREPVLVIDHERHVATLNMTVETGGIQRFGKFHVNADAPFDARHVAVISRFAPGDSVRQSDITDLNRALVATGLVSQVNIKPRPGEKDGQVDLDLTLSKAPMRTIAGELGYGTGEGVRLDMSWQHRNFFPPEGALTIRGVLGEQEQALSATVRRANFGHRDRVLNVEISAANLNQPAYQARIGGLSASLERQTNLIFQKDWTWSLGVEFKLSDERDLYGADLVPRRRTYGIIALPTGFNYDGSDDLLDPRRGFRLGLRLSPEMSLQGGAFGYARTQFDGSFYAQAGNRITLAGRSRIGTIIGASRDRIAPTRRFYAGGGASVRGFSYQAIGPRDLNNAPIGGRSLAEFSLEARFRFGPQDQFGVVPFIDAGTISTGPLPSLKEMRVGAGLGLRYYSSFGPIRIDIGTPLNPQKGDSPIGVYVSLGQAF